MKKSKIMMSLKAKRSILRMMQRDRSHRPLAVLEAKAQSAQTAVSQLAKYRREAQRCNEDLLMQKASV